MPDLQPSRHFLLSVFFPSNQVTFLSAHTCLQECLQLVKDSGTSLPLEEEKPYILMWAHIRYEAILMFGSRT